DPLRTVPRELLEALARSELLPSMPASGNATPATDLADVWEGAPAEILKRARSYLAKMPPAIQGQGGDRVTFTAACRLVCDFALSPEQALPLMQEYSQRCQPPWTKKELQHKLQQAVKRRGRRGKLLQRTGPARSKIDGDKSTKARAFGAAWPHS